MQKEKSLSLVSSVCVGWALFEVEKQTHVNTSIP